MIDNVSIERLASGLRGRLVGPASEDYDETRKLWNGMIDRRPELIVKCAGSADVIAAVDFARDHRLPLAIRSGGHNVAGRAACDDGVVIDLSAMKGVRVDPNAKIAHVQPGVRWGDLDHEAQSFGLATTGGVDSRTGVAGLTLGGGIGYLARRCGLAADNLLAAELVLADGSLVRASEQQNPDILWALRGGGGGFAVVTAMELRLHEVGPEVMTAQIFHPLDDAEGTLRYYRDFMASAPDALSCYALLVKVPPAPPFPEAFHGQPALALVACYSGSIVEGEKLLQPLADFGEPILKAVGPMSYTALQRSFDAGAPDGARYYYKSQFLDDLTDEAIATLIGQASQLPGAFTVIGIEPMGGAINRVAPDATAFPHRHTAFNLGVWAGWEDPREDAGMIRWTREAHQSMTGHAGGGVYSNYLSEDDAGQLGAAFGPNYERLQAIASRYDPQGIFRPRQPAL